MKANSIFAKVSAVAVTLATLAANVSPLLADETKDQSVTFYGAVTDAGQVVDKMTIDYGDDLGTTITIDSSSVDTSTYKVHFKSTADYGAKKESKDPVYAEKDLTITNVSVSGNVVTVDFDQTEAATLTWLAEGRNYPGKLELSVTQEKEIKTQSSDKRELDPISTTKYTYTNNVSSYEQLVDDEVSKFTGVKADINYQIHKGTNKSLIVWFHGNGEGDFSTETASKLTENNVAQMLANRGTVAWVTEEAQSVFGDATVMSFQSPGVWYTATKDNYLEQAYNEIQAVIKEQGIDPSQVYVSGCSAGGFMTTRMIIKYPDLFKAAMINCPALDIADLRAGFEGATPTDEELNKIKDSQTAIWLVQGETDSSVNPENCSKRMFKILTEGENVSEKSFDNGIASGYTTYETADNKYKLTLYETVDQADITGTLGDTRKGGKLKFVEDYNKDGVAEEVKYNDHWSWIYTLRNNPTAADGTHIWQWAANYTEKEVVETVSGTQKVFVVGDDWGPAVNKTILTLDKEVEASSLNAENFNVVEIKENTDWVTNVGAVIESESDRTVTNVYLSDEKGNKVDSTKGNIVTVEMYISPNDGSPFRYDLATGSNKWVNKYQLIVDGKATADGKEVKLSVNNSLDLKDQNNWYTDAAYKFDVTGSYTGTDGTVMPYGLYSPSTDGKKHALVVWLHGAGEGVGAAGNYGNDNYVDLLGNEVTSLASDEFQSLFEGGAYVLTPQAQTMWMDSGDGTYQNGDKGSMYEKTLFELIQKIVKENNNIDPSRVIIGGCSNGGYMTMEMVLKHPDYFYKAYPICEAFYDEYITDDMITAVKNGGTEFWFTYAENDTTVDPTKTAIPTIKRLKAAGVTVHTSVWSDVHDTTGRFKKDDGSAYQYNGHWSWTYFFNNQNTCDDCKKNEWEWLAEYKSDNNTVKPSKKSAKTSDDSNVLFYGGVMLIALVGVAGVVVLKKRHN